MLLWKTRQEVKDYYSYLINHNNKKLEILPASDAPL